jgi:hypothetical protein
MLVTIAQRNTAVIFGSGALDDVSAEVMELIKPDPVEIGSSMGCQGIDQRRIA